jgi:hypothetical protein
MDGEGGEDMDANLMEPNQAPSNPLQTSARRPRIDPRKVARDVVLLLILSAIGGFVVGLATAGTSNAGNFGIGVVAANVVTVISGFAISGALCPGNRWPHLRWVAFFAWIPGVFNLLLGLSFTDWLLGLPMMYVFMGVGGSLSPLLRRIFSDARESPPPKG